MAEGVELNSLIIDRQDLAVIDLWKGVEYELYMRG